MLCYQLSGCVCSEKEDLRRLHYDVVGHVVVRLVSEVSEVVSTRLEHFSRDMPSDGTSVPVYVWPSGGVLVAVLVLQRKGVVAFHSLCG